MQSLVHILLSNAASALVLAILIWPIGRVVGKPAIIRALWVIVLLKLISPPVLSIPLDRLIPRHDHLVARPLIPFQQIQPALQDLVAPPPTFEPPAPRRSSFGLTDGLLLIWLAGSGVLLAIGVARIYRLSRILRNAEYAPWGVQKQAANICARLGVIRPPGVWFVPGVVCPALWAFGRRCRVIVPYNLWSRLDEVQRQTLLAHELAHLRRRDHWVRLLEFIATVAYWWHPAVWFACRQIHDSEEQCCDAWVLWAMPASARSYGSALLEAVDFVSTYRPMRPALAAGLGEFRHLKRRLLMIKQGTVSRTLSRTSLVAICGAAAFALPLTPSIGQETPAPPGAAPATVSPRRDLGSKAASSESPEVAEARQRVQQLRRELESAVSRLAVLEHGASGGPAAAGVNSDWQRGGAAAVGSTSSGYNNRTTFGSSASPGAMAGAPPAGGSGIAGGGGIGSYGRGESDPRFESLEKQLHELMNQVRELKETQQKEHNRGTEAPGRE